MSQGMGAECREPTVDEQVAKRVMGWQQMHLRLQCWGRPGGLMGSCEDAGMPLPKFSTDIAAAFMVVERMKELGYVYSLYSNTEGFGCKCTFYMYHKPSTINPPSMAGTESMAICLAALDAVVSVKIGDPIYVREPRKDAATHAVGVDEYGKCQQVQIKVPGYTTTKRHILDLIGTAEYNSSERDRLNSVDEDVRSTTQKNQSSQEYALAKLELRVKNLEYALSQRTFGDHIAGVK